ncbi:Esterase YbfF [compost metagenome]
MKQNSIDTLININRKRLYLKLEIIYPNRPIIIFLHDSLGCVKLWRYLPEQLAKATQCNILIYDRLGYGNSDPMPTYERPVNYLELEADLLNELLQQLNIDQAILFGHSDGGSIALLTASKYPDNIKAVICEAAHIYVEDVTLQGIYSAIEAYKNTDLPQRLQKYHGDKVDYLFKAWTETWTRSDFKNWNIEHFLQGISCPLLFIQGECDEYSTLEQVEKTIAQVKGRAEKYIIQDIGHTPHKEVPDLVLNATKNFIESL